MSRPSTSPPNPKRVAAGRRNRSKRGPLTAEGRERLRQTALANKPWLKSTGPRTAEGKAKVARNGKKKGRMSVRERGRAIAEVSGLLEAMVACRRLVD